MAIAISETVATTLFHQREETADSISNSIPILLRLKSKGLIETVSGGYEYRMPVEYASSTGTWFAGYEQLPTTPADIYSAFAFEPKQAVVPCTASGFEVRINKGSKYQLVKFLTGKIENSKKALRNLVDTSLQGDGTSYSGKELTGMAAHVAASPTAGSIGGQTRSGYSWAQNQTYGFAADLGKAWSAATIQEGLLAAWLEVVRGNEQPDLGLLTATPWKYYHQSLTPMQRMTNDSDLAKAGFQTLKFMNVDCVLNAGYGITESTANIRLLTTDGWRFFVHEDLNFSSLGGKREPVDQDALIAYVGVMGNLCCSNYPFNSYICA